MTVHPGNLAGLPPMGLKDLDAVKTPRQRKRLRSKRKKATAMESGHMGAVAGLPCLVCGCWPVEVHHEGKPRCNTRVLPLCPRHHRREYGSGAYHYSPSAFYVLHGTSEALLKRVDELLAAYEADCLGTWF